MFFPLILSVLYCIFGLFSQTCTRVFIFNRWWKGLDVPNNLPYARDRVVECYFWAVCVCHEPQYSNARVFLAKVICMQTLLDDTYDAYGIYEELEIFTEAIQRYALSTN